MNDGPITDFDMYYTKSGIIQVSNEVRRRILIELHDKNLSLTDLSHIIGKAQSTLSVHLDRMVSDGLIASHDDPDDNRRKVYSLVSVRLAHSKPPSDESLDLAFRMLSEVAQDPEGVCRMLPRFIFLGFDGMGLSAGPMASILGRLHAMALNGSLSGETLEDTVANARDYYRRMGITDASVFSLKPLTVIIKDDMPFLEGSELALGSYAAGFFSKVLEDYSGKTYEVVSSEVFGTDHNYYRFILEPVRSEAQ